MMTPWKGCSVARCCAKSLLVPLGFEWCLNNRQTGRRLGISISIVFEPRSPPPEKAIIVLGKMALTEKSPGLELGMIPVRALLIKRVTQVLATTRPICWERWPSALPNAPVARPRSSFVKLIQPRTHIEPLLVPRFWFPLLRHPPSDQQT